MTAPVGGLVPHTVAVDDVCHRLGVDLTHGLDPAEAAERLTAWGPNTIDSGGLTPWWRHLLAQLSSVLVWILIAAALVSGLVLGDVVDAVVILAIVVVNTAIGFTQESRAEGALASLEEMAAPAATVIRGGEIGDIPTRDVVPGDVLVISAGDRIPADARLAEVARLAIDESSLTGESVPVTKGTGIVGDDAGLADRTNMVHAGTVVANGRGRAVVTATGSMTEMGSIAAMLSAEVPPSPLEAELARIGKRIAFLAGLAAVVIFVVGIAQGGELESIFLTAVALAVAAIPEGLPTVTTITLAGGVRAMAAHNAIVRRLPAVEALGACHVICTDKTGTLTANRMAVERVVLGRESDETLAMAGLVAALCSDVVVGSGGMVGDPTEVALLEEFHPRLLDAPSARVAAPRLDEAAFDSTRKRMATLHAWEGRYLLAVKGAPEVVIDRCDRWAGGGSALGDGDRRRLSETAEELAADGLRTLALAYRILDEPPARMEDAETGLEYVGVVAMSDQLRPTAAPAVAKARQAGIEVVMVTGDHLVTARAVAERLGLLDDRRVVGGSILAGIDETALAAEVASIGAFARVDPADKVKIVKAWQQNGAIVAMTGDGVNDAPALRMANVGVAMGSGTDVAREAADMVLAGDDFSTIVDAVERGRAIFSNLRKVVYFLLAANISEIITMLVGVLAFASRGEPLLAVQLLWVNLITDGLPALALGVDPPDPDVMRLPPVRDRNILGLPHQLRLLWQGGLLSVAPLGMYVYGTSVPGQSWEGARTLAFSSLVLVQLLHAFTVRAQHRSVWRTPVSNPYLVGAVVASVLLQALVVVTPIGNDLFSTEAMSMSEWLIVMGGALIPFVVIDAVKVAVRRRRPLSASGHD